MLGAFLLPLALAVLVPGLLLGADSASHGTLFGREFLPFHITVALLGVTAFASRHVRRGRVPADGTASKAKKFGFLFSRLPPLEVLDGLNQQLLSWGFVALSITIVTGAFFASSGHGFFWQWEPKEIATVAAWAGAGVLVNARFFAGWRGKRVALATMAGFCLLLVSFVTSFEVGESTRWSCCASACLTRRPR